MTVKSFFIAILASLLCFSCSETNLESTQITNTQEEPKVLYTYDVDIEATSETPKDSTQATRIADMSFKITEANLSGKSTLVPKINIKEDSVESVVVFYNKTTDTKTVQQAKWKVLEKGAKIKLRLQHLKSYANFKTGEWYLMSFIGGGNLQGEKLNVQTKTDINVITKDQELKTSCPFATPWRKIECSNSRLTLADTKTQMNFAPQGVFLVLNVESRMSLPTKLDRNITLESNAFTSTGYYEFKITKNEVTDKADLAFNYWNPTGVDKNHDPYPVYEKFNGKHYITRLTLNYQSNVYDGSERRDQTDHDRFIYFKKKEKTSTAQATKPFLLCVMPVDYRKGVTYSGIETQALFYGKVQINDDKRIYPTSELQTYGYTTDIGAKSWYPYMDGRYLLGSFCQDLTKGSSNKLTLRIVRPMLPIEHLWAYRQGSAMETKYRGEAESIAEGNTSNGNYPTLTSHQYRLPKYSELMPILHNCKYQLDNHIALGGLNGYPTGEEYGQALAIMNPDDYTDINGKQYRFDNWFCTTSGENVLYGIMNMKPFKRRGDTETNNYKVAVKMTFDNVAGTSGMGHIQVYYLGPNYNLSVKTAGFYCCHEQFWRKLTDKDIIDRIFPVGGDYWLNDKKELHSQYEKRSEFNSFNTDGKVQRDNHNGGGWKKGFFLPWLKEPAW